MHRKKHAGRGFLGRSKLVILGLHKVLLLHRDAHSSGGRFRNGGRLLRKPNSHFAVCYPLNRVLAPLAHAGRPA